MEFYADSTEGIDLSRTSTIAQGISGELTRLDQYVLVLRFFEICRGMSTDNLSLVISNVLMDVFHFTSDVRNALLQFGSTIPIAGHDHESILLVNFEAATEDPGPVLNKRDFTVIHQPSSQIFKMFDKLWILDRGGRPIYNGNPIDAITYFRRAVNLAGMDETVCPGCGSVSPEQIFELIEMRALDNYGHWTGERRISPQEWHARYLKDQQKHAGAPPVQLETLPPPSRGLQRPSLANQSKIFFQRIVKARLSNRQYLLITLLEPPVLALFIGAICRGFGISEYVFQDNENIGVYLFMSVIVAIFLGLSLSAEEINRDRKILQREQFLNLSWFSYIKKHQSTGFERTGIGISGCFR